MRRCKICKKVLTIKHHWTIYCKECDKTVREQLRKIHARYNTIDICPGGGFVSNDDAYINLAGAIVRVTLEDYEYVLTMIQLYPNDVYYANQKKSLERIIKSEYFDMLCLNICPEKLIRDIHNLYYGPKGY